VPVSVILPVHNGEHYFREAINSIRRQSFRDFQFIIIDDGSIDGTPNIIRKAEREDPRIVSLVNDGNRGLPAALNRAIGRAEGEYIVRMDADDVAHPDRIERQVRYMEQNPHIVASGTWAMRIDERGLPVSLWKSPIKHEEIAERLLKGRGGQVIHPTAILRTKTLREVGGYREQDWGYAEDYDLWLRLLDVGTLANLPTPLLRYRISMSRVTTANRTEQLEEVERLCNQYRTRRDLPSITVDKTYDRWCRREHFVEAALRSGFLKTAVRNWFLLRVTDLEGLKGALRLGYGVCREACCRVRRKLFTTSTCGLGEPPRP